MPAAELPGLLGELPVVATSVSGQFVVHGRDAARPAAGRELRPVGDGLEIDLRPELLAVSCERVKRGVLQRLEQQDAWTGKIHLVLQRQPGIDRPVAIRPQVFREGWQFTVALPDRIQWPRLVRALTEAVLLDLANRENPTTVCAQPPLWLAEGMSALIVGESGRDLVIEPQTTLNRSERKADVLRDARAALNSREPMGFSALTLATPERLGRGDDFAHFQASAALLVHVLTEGDRRARTASFLRQLSGSLNWQTTFLAAHRDEFATLLDAEKWWAVNAADELARGPAAHWSEAEVRGRLRDLLGETAMVRGVDGTVAPARRISLGDLVREWDFAAQEGVLQRKLSQLRLLLLRTPPESTGLRRWIRDGADTIESYLTQRRGASGDSGIRGDVGGRVNVMVKTAARRLDRLTAAVNR